MAHRQTIQDDEAGLAAFLSQLITDRVIYFPIRHHSPACAWHVAQVIREKRPASILIEGPESFDALLPELASEETVAPVAVFTQFIDRRKTTLPATHAAPTAQRSATPPRYAAYYPLCDYSPELVAIREGKQISARLAFCDLDYPDQIVAESSSAATEERPANLLDERHFLQNRYLRELARRRGCRDTNELWDRLFECDFQGADTPHFIEKVATYCYYARCNTLRETLETEGTLVRESRMAQIIHRELSRLKRRREQRPLLVITGGFHTPALACSTADRKATFPNLQLAEDEAMSTLIRYSFPQLDALNGYAAGMPSPGYYQRLWQRATADEETPLETLSRQFLVKLPQHTRNADLSQALSTADVIAAHHHACNLARFRGNPGPMREDVLDGIRSSFVKGSLDAEGAIVINLALELMRGDAIGSLPKTARIHPLVRDFQQQANELGIGLDTTLPKKTRLEIYRREKHVRLSRFFRCLEFLDVPFATFTAGPDFESGTHLELQIEHWTYSWRPQTDSSLITAAIYGTGVGDTVMGKLQAYQDQLEQAGADAGATQAVSLLRPASRLGAGTFVTEFLSQVREKLQVEHNFSDCLAATQQINLWHRHPSPLESDQPLDLWPLLHTAYQRCCQLVSTLSHCADDQIPIVLDQLPFLREVLLTGTDQNGFDPRLLWDATKRVLEDPSVPPPLSGGLHGLLFTAGELTRTELLTSLQTSVLSADRSGPSLARFLHGLFALSRDLTWQDPVLMTAIHDIIQGWNEAEFHEALPYLRLAFAQHTPQETNRVAGLVATLTNNDTVKDWYQHNVDEPTLLDYSYLAAQVHHSLENDQLLGLLDDGE